ncbi:MAG: hypothetical protein ACI87H_001895, partial [Gammaproteobacteria bacterium]
FHFTRRFIAAKGRWSTITASTTRRFISPLKPCPPQQSNRQGTTQQSAPFAIARKINDQV